MTMLYAQMQAAVEGAIKQTSAQVIQDMGIEPLCNKLLAIPDQIRELQGQMAEAQKEVDKARSDMELEKSVITAAVTSELNGNGKPAFSNETARSAEITRRMAVDQDYLAAKEALATTEEQVASLKFDIDRLYSEMANLRAVVSARAAQVQALFGN
jgi:peptidoglycan hydrolase CwlO-like protein